MNNALLDVAIDYVLRFIPAAQHVGFDFSENIETHLDMPNTNSVRLSKLNRTNDSPS